MALSQSSAAVLRADHEARQAERAEQAAATVAALKAQIVEAQTKATAGTQRAEAQLADELAKRSRDCRKFAIQKLTPLVADFLVEPSRAKAGAFAAAVRSLDHAFGHEIGIGMSPRLVTFSTAKAMQRERPQAVVWLARHELTSLGLGDPRNDVLSLEGALVKAIAADDSRAISEALDDLATAIRKQAPSTMALTAEDEKLFMAKALGDQAVLDAHAAAERASAEAVARENGRRAAEHAAREQAAW